MANLYLHSGDTFLSYELLVYFGFGFVKESKL